MEAYPRKDTLKCSLQEEGTVAGQDGRIVSKVIYSKCLLDFKVLKESVIKPFQRHLPKHHNLLCCRI